MSAQFITPKKRPHSPLDSNELLPSFEDPQDMINAVVSTLLAPEEKPMFLLHMPMRKIKPQKSKPMLRLLVRIGHFMSSHWQFR